MSRRVPIILAVLAATPAAWADELDEAHKRMLGRGDLQFDFDGPPPRPPPPDNSWVADLLNGVAPIFNFIFWVAVGALILGILYFIGREIWQTRFGGDRKVQKTSPIQQTEFRPAPERARALLDDADKLAAQGLFEEAVRVLLHRSIEDIERRAPRAINRAQTSREIERLSVLSGAARDAFAPLVRAVERSWFGGVTLGEQDYRDCRTSYARFALPEAWA